MRQHHYGLSRGFSLVELMVAVALGLILLAGLFTLFLTNSRSYREIDNATRQIENGRYAIQLLTDDIRMAGYYGEFDPTELATPASPPDICDTTQANLIAGMPLHVQGLDADANTPTCIADRKTGTDILVVRRTAACIAGTAGCDALTATVPFLQASTCNSMDELESGNPLNYFILQNGPDNAATFKLRKRDCSDAGSKTGTRAPLRRYRTHIYYVANNDKASDGIPTLKRLELGANGYSTIPLVNGIENLQIEYGLDLDAVGSPKVYTADPNSYAACAGTACAKAWRNTIAVKLHVLARNTEKTAGYTDVKQYSLGLAGNGEPNLAGPFNDPFKRHVYTTVVSMNNPAGRNDQ